MPPKRSKGSVPSRMAQAAKPVIKLIQQQPSRSVGSRIGGWVGDMAQKALMSITGMGDYTVKSNSFVVGNSPPVFGVNGKHNITVRHREFFTTLSSPGAAFTNTTYYINPTAAPFPWLSALATNFELFKFHGLVFEFKATSATAVSSTNTALGSVIMATQYNALSPPFTSQTQMEAYEFSTSTVAFTSCIHPVECAPSSLTLTELYTDLGFSSGDPRFTILGILNVATVGQQAASVLGELWVSYDIELIRPRLFGSIASQGYTFKIASAVGLSAVSSSDIFSALAAAQVQNARNGYGVISASNPQEMSLDVTIGSFSQNTGGGLNNTIQFPRGLSGVFRILFYLDFSSASAAAINYASFSSSGGLVIQNEWSGATVSTLVFPNNGSTTTDFLMEVTISIGVGPFGVNSGIPTLTLSGGGTYPGAGSSGQYFLDIFQVNS